MEGTEMFEPKIKNRQTDLLMKAVILLHDEEDAYRFFEDLCTIPEIKSISQRLEVAELLRRKETYQKIAEETGAIRARCGFSRCGDIPRRALIRAGKTARQTRRNRLKMPVYLSKKGTVKTAETANSTT